MIDHIGIAVTDLERSVTFYKAALAPLGYTLIKHIPGDAAGFGIDGKPDFWIGAGPMQRTHVAILAPGRTEIRSFHAAALAAGGTDNGAPGVRDSYSPDYYAAFVLDPDGNNIEAVCRKAYLG